MSSPTKMTTRHAAATIAALTALLALPACRETVSCIDHPSPVCPDAFGYGLDANLPRDGGPDAPGLDANVDAFNAPDAYSPDSGTDGGPCSRCAPSSPACFMDGCVECTSENTSACTGGMPACDTSAHECVQCTSTSTSACTGATPACDATAHTCVECTSENTSACTGTTPSCGGDQRCTCTTTSCTSVSASRCDAASRACASCAMDGECSHLAGTPRCVGGTCMPCTVATEVADCGATSCNPATHTCTTTPRGSRTVCTTCVADSECGTGLTCCEASPMPAKFIKDGDTITVGEISLACIHTPGHSPGSITFFHETAKGQKIAIAGDVLFNGSIGRTDLPMGDYDTLISSIKEKLFPLGDDTIVYSGHGPSTTIGKERVSNPFLV